MRRAVALTVVALLLVLPAVRGARAQDAESPLDALQNRNAQFACDLFRAVGGSGGNLFLSPHSVSTALAMARAGAAGETARQMDAVLHLPAQAPAAFRALVRSLADAKALPDYGPQGRGPDVPAYALAVANGVFTQRGWPFHDAFRRTVADDFAAEFRELDFEAAGEARAAINRWVEEKTKDRIKDLVPEGLPTPDTRMVLANAIHFKASWDEPFPESATADGPFTVAAGKDVVAKRMRRTAHFAYGETADVRVLDVPYRGRETSMLVVLPRAKDGLDALAKGLKAETVWGWRNALATTKVALELPKFTFTSEMDLGRVLAGLGMTDAFDASRADFTGISDRKPLFIGAVLHKAFVAVDEKGTEAAAATAVMMRAGAAPRPEEPVPFVVDHPFLFLLVHRRTGAILFVGRVVDPTAS